MKKLPTKSKQGFTIIEVVLVLAIAGLIFLMVFVALPTLQTSQRDTQRRNDMNTIASQLIQYQNNNGGKLPTNTSSSNCAQATNFQSDYVSNLADPSTGNYKVYVCKAADGKGGGNDYTTTDKRGRVDVYIGAECNGEVTKISSGDRIFAVIYKLEGAGTVCVDNK